MELGQSRSQVQKRYELWRSSVEFGDVLIFPYFLALTRQYFWIIENNFAAWVLSLAAAVVCWVLYVTTKPGSKEPVAPTFWLVVAVPLLFFYSLRVMFPDVSFDVLNYHLFHGERGLRGPLFLAAEFFPTAAPYNPTPDILTGLYRWLLGYRLGTIVNYLTLVWTGLILDRVFREYIKSAWTRSAGVLFVLISEHFLFQINNYMVDLLALPLMLEATRLALTRSDVSLAIRNTSRIALLLGISAALKLSNLVIAIPILLIFGFNSLQLVMTDFRGNASRWLKTLALSVLIFCAPLMPFSIYLYKLTGNPVFPFYNAIFRSTFWPQSNIFDPRWGPHGLKEVLLWPILIVFKPERLSELGVYSGRISIAFVAAAICLVLVRRHRAIRELSFITLLGAILWSAAVGIGRYALFIEVTSGVLLVWLLWFVHMKCARRSPGLRLLIQAPLWIVLLVQTTVALNYAVNYEWSMRATIFKHRVGLVLRESKNFFRDRSLIAYLAPADRVLLNDVDAWIETTYKTAALEVMLKPSAPILGVRSPEYFVNEESRKRFYGKLDSLRGKRLFTLTDEANLQRARLALANRGLGIGETRTFTIPFFSRSLKLDMLLVEVIAGSTSVQPGVALPDSAFKAELLVAEPLEKLRAGEKHTIHVTITNAGDLTWPGRQEQWQYQITVGNRWLGTNGATIADVDGRAPVYEKLRPKEGIPVTLTITAPASPGDYLLQIDAIQEGVAWFGDRGSPILNLKVRVE